MFDLPANNTRKIYKPKYIQKCQSVGVISPSPLENSDEYIVPLQSIWPSMSVNTQNIDWFSIASHALQE